MSSTHYSSQHGAPRCQRCGASLPLASTRCTNCGLLNAPLATNNAQQSKIFPDAQEPQNSQARHLSQSGDAFKNYVAAPEQRTRYSQPTSQVSNTGPTTPPTSFGTPSQPWSHAGIARQPISSGPQTGNLSPTYAQAPFHEDKPQRRSQVGRIVGISALLIALIGASFLAYTFLFPQKSTPNGGSTSLQSAPTNPVPQGNPLFQDNFASNNNGWNIQSYPGEFAVSLGNGSLKLENDSHKLLWEVLPGAKTYSDFQLSVDASLSKGSQDNGYGVYVRGALSQNMTITSFYRFELYGDGSFAIFKGTTDANGTTTTPRLVDYTNNSAILKQGGVNHITISAQGSNMQFLVNNQTLSTIKDATYTSGAIALFVSNLQNATPGAVATFSHLAVYPPQK